MFRYTAKMTSGHYGFPTPTRTGVMKFSSPHPHLSTIRGHLESLMGLQRGEFEGDIALGILGHPSGKGTPLRMNTACSAQKAAKEGDKKIAKAVVMRPWKWETFYGVACHIAVRGPQVELLQAAIRGEVPRYGILTLGTSDDEVYDITPEEIEAQWVVPGGEFPLIIESQEGWKNRTPKMGMFALSPKQQSIPDEAWHSFTKNDVGKKKPRAGKLG